MRVDFSLPWDKRPAWVSTTPLIDKFRLDRRPEFDVVLREFLRILSEDHSGDNLRIPAWHYPPGADHVALPFGQVVAAYGSVDLPLLPVL